jgi:hypothetical protein
MFLNSACSGGKSGIASTLWAYLNVIDLRMCQY